MKRLILSTCACFLLCIFIPKLLAAQTLEHLVSPGPLSNPHKSLEANCSTCHTAFQGIQKLNCVQCHASNEILLGRAPTAFHASIKECTGCHIEHQGRDTNISLMDHSTLARMGMQMYTKDLRGEAEELTQWLFQNGLKKSSQNSSISVLESSLNCLTCHGAKDRHQGFFGSDCAECHSTNAWGIKGFKHPSSTSRDCAQCHKAPPSHYMMHFEMISKKVAGVEHANVSQCYACHQTTSWNDIKGVGWYKHH